MCRFTKCGEQEPHCPASDRFCSLYKKQKANLLAKTIKPNKLIMAPKVAIIIYSMYHHVATMAESVKAGVTSAGGTATIFQVPETLPDSVLVKMHAPPKPDYPIATMKTLEEFETFIIGVPTRFGNFPVQWKSFWDQTGGLWQLGKLQGKPFGVFVATSVPGGGQESTVMNCLSTMVHHGMPFIPLGFSPAATLLSNLSEVHGSSAWGAGCFSGSDGSRKASPLELEIAKIQGKEFYEAVKKF